MRVGNFDFYLMREVFLVVFEDSPLELVDAEMVFADSATAHEARDRYQAAYTDGKRRLIVRNMRLRTKTGELVYSAKPVR